MNRSRFLQNLKVFWEKNDIPNISLDNALYLRDIIQKLQARNILEIGTANGYSTIHFADEIEKWGWHIDTIEFSPNSFQLAKENFQEAQVWHLITQYLGNALDVLPTLEKKYDFIFIDGMKKRSLDFLLLVWEKVDTWGIIVIDDVIKFRHKMENLYEYLEENKTPYIVEQIDADDGIMILKK